MENRRIYRKKKREREWQSAYEWKGEAQGGRKDTSNCVQRGGAREKARKNIITIIEWTNNEKPLEEKQSVMSARKD